MSLKGGLKNTCSLKVKVGSLRIDSLHDGWAMWAKD